MSRILRYAHNVVNVQGDTIPYRTCWDIENISGDESNVGHWGASNPGGRYANAIAGRNGSRKHPSTIRCSDFRFDREGNNVLIPDHAHVTGIIVQYNYRKRSYSSNTAHGSFGNPVISIPNLGLSGTGNAPPRNDFTEYNVYFGNLDLKGSDVNTSDFTVLFDLPENTSTNPCYIEMKYLRVYIDFDLPNYVPSISLDKSELKYGENLKITCKLNETNAVMASEQCSALLTIPEGFNIVSAPSNFNTTTKIWSPVTRNFTANMELEVTLSDRNVYGDFIFKITEQMTWNSQEARLNENSQEGGLFVLKPQVEMASFYLENHEVSVSEGNNKHYASLEIQIKNPAHDTVKLEMDFGGLSVEGNPTGLDKSTNIITINNWDANDLYDVQILLYSTEVGDYTISMISDSFMGVYSDTVKVHLPDNLEPYYTMFALDDEALENLEEGYTYTFGCLCKITDTTTATVQASSTIRNLRASIINGSDEIFTNQLSQAGDWELLKCEFVYDPTKQIYCKFYGNYTTYDFGKISFGDIFLIRSDKYSGYEYPTLKFRDTSKLKANGLYTTLLLEPPELSTSTKHYFSIFDYLGLDKAQSIVIHGLEVSGDVSTDGIINVILGFGHEHIAELDYHLDSLNLDENSTNFKLGGKFRSFGISFKDVLNLLNDIKFYLQVDDVMDNVTPIQVSMRNICLTVYYSLNASPCDFKINGVSSNHYCIELNAESEIPRGVNYDVNKYEIEGSDGEFVNKVNIRGKKLKLKFSAYGDNFEDSTELLRYVTEFLYPKRNKLDKPILNNISFFFDENNCYDYYIDDVIDCEAKVGGYDCDVDLIIPSGVARSIDQLEKSFAGDTGHIGKIKPVITFYKQRNNFETGQIQLIEQESNQIMKLEGAFIEELPDGTLMELDCSKRKLSYYSFGEWFNVDVNYITLDSDFFVLEGYYNFENCINCRVRDVNYHEIIG